MSENKIAKKIMVVDDDVDLLLQLKMQLEAVGYDVTTAESVSEAEKLIETYAPDLAIVDLMMERMDGGFVLCYHIKRKDPKTPVIMVTGVTADTGFEFDSATDEERSWLKADVTLAKPVRIEQLTREMTRLLKG